jgi:PBSX family phage terminase large subunit
MTTASVLAERLYKRILPQNRFVFRGANERIQHMRDAEVGLCGPAGTGKTLAILVKIHREMMRYPNARALIVRKVRADLSQSALVTFERDVVGEAHPMVTNVQREHRRVYRYANGSRIIVGGMDRATAVMSAEYDIIYVQEAIELSENDFESLVLRLRNGVMPYQQLIFDTNPDKPRHWLKLRAERGDCIMLDTALRDNPRFYGADGVVTEDGRQYLEKLAKISGVRRARYVVGSWVQAEGAVYDEWSDAVHYIDKFDIPQGWRKFLSIDFGYTNAFVCQWWAQDDDGRLYLYREIYMSRRLVSEHASDITRYSADETIEFVVGDHDAEGRATLEAEGWHVMPADKSVNDGIQAVKDRLQVAGDGKARLFIMRGALVERDQVLVEDKKPTSTYEEIGGYVWSPNKDVPVKADDHGLDAMRYAVMAVRDAHFIIDGA